MEFTLFGISCDGTDGEVIQLKPRNGYLEDIPLAKYTVTARYIENGSS